MNSLLLRWSSSLALLPFMIAFLATSRSVADPTPPAPAPTEVPNHHIPFNPFESARVLPTSPYGSPPSTRRSVLAKPEGVDLDVTFISRTPMHYRYEVWYTADGNVLVVDSANDRVQVLSFDGTGLDFVRALIADFDKPTGVATYGGGYIIVADTGNKRVVSILEALPAWKVYMPMVRIDE